MEQLTIHGALRELKLLDARIEKIINSATFVSVKKKSSKTEFVTMKVIEDFEKEAKAKLNSVEDLIKRRNAIKNAIVISNATTKVKVGKVEMTVAEAIERKNSIYNEKVLVSTLKTQLRNSLAKAERENANMELALDRQVQNLTNGDSTKIDGIKSFMEVYRADNGWEMIDPLGVESIIETKSEGIEDFLANVDEALSVSNAITTIEI